MQNDLTRSLTQPSLGLYRREMIRVGGLSMAGLALSDRYAHPTTEADRAKHCIILFLSGGNPQHDMFDPKPDDAGSAFWRALRPFSQAHAPDGAGAIDAP